MAKHDDQALTHHHKQTHTHETLNDQQSYQNHMVHSVNNDQSPQKEYPLIPNTWSCMGAWLSGVGTHGPCAFIWLALASSYSKILM